MKTFLWTILILFCSTANAQVSSSYRASHTPFGSSSSRTQTQIIRGKNGLIEGTATTHSHSSTTIYRNQFGRITGTANRGKTTTVFRDSHGKIIGSVK